jgi:hypothetical protein
MIEIKAKDGMCFENGARTLYLGEGMREEDFPQITIEEYKERLRRENEED